MMTMLEQRKKRVQAANLLLRQRVIIQWLQADLKGSRVTLSATIVDNEGTFLLSAHQQLYFAG